MDEDNRVFEGQEYDHNYMMEAVKAYHRIKRRIATAKEELREAEESVEPAREEVDDAQMEYHNVISEWEEFPPFKEELVKLSKGS